MDRREVFPTAGDVNLQIFYIGPHRGVNGERFDLHGPRFVGQFRFYDFLEFRGLGLGALLDRQFFYMIAPSPNFGDCRSGTFEA